MTRGTFFTIKGLKQGLDWIVSSSVHIMRKPSAVWGDVRNTEISQMQILALGFLIRFSFFGRITHTANIKASFLEVRAMHVTVI